MNDESKSKENLETETIEEESVLNRPRQKLSVAKEKNQKPETTAPVASKVVEEEESKPDKLEIVKEKVSKAVYITKKKLDDVLKGGTSLKTAAKAIFSSGKLTVACLTVVLVMIVITIFSYYQISLWVSSLTAPFFVKEPLTESFFDYLYYFGWALTRLAFKGIAAIIVFYASFIFAYTVASPLYAFISILAEDIYFGRPEDAPDFSFDVILEDVIQALKVVGVALLITIFVFFVNFVPVIGQIAAITFFIVLNSLMLIDFPASRRGWRLTEKALWIRKNPLTAARVGSLPALISMIPIANNILLAFLFPLFVVHATMNFAAVEKEDAAK